MFVSLLLLLDNDCLDILLHDVAALGTQYWKEHIWLGAWLRPI